MLIKQQEDSAAISWRQAHGPDTAVVIYWNAKVGEDNDGYKNVTQSLRIYKRTDSSDKLSVDLRELKWHLQVVIYTIIKHISGTDTQESHQQVAWMKPCASNL